MFVLLIFLGNWLSAVGNILCFSPIKASRVFLGPQLYRPPRTGLPSWLPITASQSCSRAPQAHENQPLPFDGCHLPSSVTSLITSRCHSLHSFTPITVTLRMAVLICKAQLKNLSARDSPSQILVLWTRLVAVRKPLVAGWQERDLVTGVRWGLLQGNALCVMHCLVWAHKLWVKL